MPQLRIDTDEHDAHQEDETHTQRHLFTIDPTPTTEPLTASWSWTDQDGTTRTATQKEIEENPS